MRICRIGLTGLLGLAPLLGSGPGCGPAAVDTPDTTVLSGSFHFVAHTDGYWNGVTDLTLDSEAATLDVTKPCGEQSYHADNVSGPVEDLRALLESTDFFHLQSMDSCPDGYVTDDRTYKLTLTYDGEDYLVSFYHGCYDLPGELESLAAEVDTLIQTYAENYCLDDG